MIGLKIKKEYLIGICIKYDNMIIFYSVVDNYLKNYWLIIT